MNGLRELLGLRGPDVPVAYPTHSAPVRRLQGPGKDVDRATVERRRAKNRRASASRRINRGRR